MKNVEAIRDILDTTWKERDLLMRVNKNKNNKEANVEQRKQKKPDVFK